MKIKKKLERINKKIKAYENLVVNADDYAKKYDKFDVNWCKECLKRLYESKKEFESYL